MSKKKTTSPFLIAMAIFLFYLSIYLVTPNLYKEIKTNQYDKTFDTLTTQISKTSDYESIVYQYAIENDAIVSVQNNSTGDTLQTPIIKSVRNYQKSINIQSNSANLSVSVVYTYASLSDINAILIILLPILGILTFFVCFGLASKQPKKERYDDFYKVTSDMLRLKPKACLKVDQKSAKKQDVAQNINELYDLLLTKSEQLDQKNQDYQLLLEKSKETLSSQRQNLQYEVKEILKIVKGMLANQGPYKNHAIYLMDIKVRLENLLENKNQTQDLPTTIHDIFQTVLKPYELLLGQKQINLTYQLEKNFKIQVDGLLFHQAIGHLMTFAINQSQVGSTMQVIQNDYDIAIAYQGACLTSESISQVEAIDENVKNCYRYVKQMGFFVEFLPTEKKDGMQFVFHF